MSDATKEFENEQAVTMAQEIINQICKWRIDADRPREVIRAALVRAYAIGKRDENARICNLIDNL